MSDKKQSERFRIMVVDDKPVISFTMEKIFEGAGYNAKGFQDPEEALNAARELRPDLLVTDVMMPKMSGIQLAMAITKALPGCEVLLVSGHATTADLMKAAKEDGHQFALLPKPVHPTELIAYVARIANQVGGSRAVAAD